MHIIKKKHSWKYKSSIIHLFSQLLVENSEALDDLQFNPTQIDVLTNVVGALAETAKIQVWLYNLNLIFVFKIIIREQTFKFW